MTIHCPLVKAPEVTLCNPAELGGLVEYLQQGELAEENVGFTKGSILNYASLDCCKQGLGPAGAERVLTALRQNPTIKHILFGTNSLGDQGVTSIADFIAEQDSLETVYLGCNLIKSDGLSALSQAIANSSRVKALWLKRNPLGNLSAGPLADMLRTNKSLRTLDLVNTGMDESGLSMIIDALIEGSAPVKSLYLGGNGIGASLAPKLSELLETNKLKALFLNVNHFGDDGINILTSSLAGNQLCDFAVASNAVTQVGLNLLIDNTNDQYFRWLDLGYSPSTKVLGAYANSFQNTYINRLADWISEQPYLQRLDLNKCGLSEKCLDALLPAVVGHASLRMFNLGFKVHNTAVREAIAATLATNSTKPMESDSYLDDVCHIKSVYR